MSDSLAIERDVAIPMRDGSPLYANIYRPGDSDRYPVVMTVGPYGKDLHFGDFNPAAYAQIAEHGPHLNWETPNPEWWVPHGYVVVRVDQRGIGRSPGRLDLFSQQQGEDFYDAIEWAALQPWSTGKVGLLGISYYALSQWQVAALHPPHLAAIIPWEGLHDMYREAIRHGGILSNVFVGAWYPRQVLSVQYGVDGSLSEQERATNRADLLAGLKAHVLDDGSYRPRARDAAQITVPLLSVGNWGGLGLHLRGNIEGYLSAASQHKWLRVHVGNHYTPFYSEEGRAAQERFFAYWLKGHDNGLLAEPRIQLAIRKGSAFAWRQEQAWPLARTRWTRWYLDAPSHSLSEQPLRAAAHLSYQAPDGGVTFTTAPFATETEVTGPLALRLWVSCSTKDMDLFVTIRNLDPHGNEVTSVGASGEPVPVTKGWLRVSHRKLDQERSTAYRPYHSHDELQFLTAGEVVPVAIEIWPTSVVFQASHRLALEIEAHDGMGSGMFLHNDPEDRNPAKLTGTNTIYTGADHASYLLLPIIPNE
jgi:predicted acyl esterase